MDSDPLGHSLYQSRLQSIPSILQQMLDSPLATPQFQPTQNFYITGIGSSEAHAHFLTHLINEHTPSNSTFLPLSSFLNPSSKNLQKLKQSTLIVFSQGLSPNSQIALAQSKLFQHTILFTANQEKASKLKNISIINVPTNDEFSILIRIIGPIAGYLAAIQFVQQYWKESTIPTIPSNLINSISQPTSTIPSNFINEISQGALILANSPLSQFSQNLVYKLTEGLFAKNINASDFLAFAHGPFQELTANPHPTILLNTNTQADNLLINNTLPMLEKINVLHLVLKTKLPHPYSILELEATFNYFLIKAMTAFKTNQRNWPGQNLDASLYNINQSL